MIRLIYLLLISCLAQAATIRLDTSVLDPTKTWYLDFQLIDGDGEDNNTVNIPYPSFSAFSPTALLRFTLSWSGNYNGTGNPDTFSWAVLDESFNSIVEDGLGASLVILLDGSAPMLFAASDTYNNVVPEFEDEVPEPSTFLMALVTCTLPLAAQRARRNARF